MDAKKTGILLFILGALVGILGGYFMITAGTIENKINGVILTFTGGITCGCAGTLLRK
ncbi:MAG: hypothetical protein K9L17_10825 [Clostridiales bacterium]|nr:hypothetical protein [Clostridiales bacterium]MCF8023174.1 hypothetical protein [Clostridiales bacterium]